MKKTLKFFTSVTLAALCAHIAATVFFSLYTSYFYHGRMINVRHLDSNTSLVPALIGGFFEDVLRKSSEKKVLFMGSSFSWGYSWPEEDIFSAKVKQKIDTHEIINASIIGDSPQGTNSLLECLATKGVKVEKLVIEVNTTNFRWKEATTSFDEYCDGSAVSTMMNQAFPYSGFFGLSPFGLGNFKIIRDEFNYTQGEIEFALAPLHDTYFEQWQDVSKNIDQRKKFIQSMIEEARKVGDEVYFFVSPIYLEAISETQFNRWDLEKYQSEIYSVCLSNKDVTCIPLHQMQDKQNFSNLTHLNLRGHKYFGEKIADEIFND